MENVWVSLIVGGISFLLLMGIGIGMSATTCKEYTPVLMIAPVALLCFGSAVWVFYERVDTPFYLIFVGFGVILSILVAWMFIDGYKWDKREKLERKLKDTKYNKITKVDVIW